MSAQIQFRPVLHDAADGLRTVDALLAALTSRRVRFEDLLAVQDALRELRDTLATGVASGARFCLFHG